MKGFKTQLDLNDRQKTLCARHAGVARHAWNWGLDVSNKAYSDSGRRPTAIDLCKRLVSEVKPGNPWYYEVSKCAPQKTLRDLELAFRRFFENVSGFPKRKKKGKRDSFYLENTNARGMRVRGKLIKLPVIGWVRTHEKLPVSSVKNCVISRRAGKWFIAFVMDVETQATQKTSGAIGVDIGITTLATLSDGREFENPRAFKVRMSRLKVVQRRLARQVKGSKNREKTKLRLQRLHLRIANIRANALHQLTSHLAKNHSEVVIEDLNVSGMLKNRKSARAIADVGMYEFRRQLEYKCKWYGSGLVIVDRFFPSSKLCSNCGQKKDSLPLSERVYKCECCGFEIGRDLNAALNLRNAGSSSVYACGATVSPSLGLAGCYEAGTKHQSALVD